MTELLHWDAQLFHFVNTSCSNAFFDFLLPILRNKYTWFPLYIFLISFILINYQKKGLYIILAMSLCVGLSDSISSHLIKKSVKRLRPCKVLEQAEDFNLLVRCGSGYSFPSSHAANHFAMAFFLLFIFGKKNRWIKPALIIWAFSIAFSQIYVGVHFPLDALAGASLGCLIAYLVYSLFKKQLQIDY
jgi:undecaprenyl-diphosphatase